MKRTIFTWAILAGALFTAEAQKAKTVKLSQTPGEFEQTELTLKAGTPYVFEVTNNGVGHRVGFVIAPAGKTEPRNHIKASYTAKRIHDGETSQSQEVVLEAGEYVYFCPLNPTPKYTIVVEE